jgi:hypothetical protein
MDLTLRILVSGLTLAVGFSSYAQTTPTMAERGCKPPIGRVLWHDRIDREQKNVLKADGRADQFMQVGNNEDINYFVTQAVISKVDDLQCKIEKDSLTGDQKKKGYLLGIERILRSFAVGYRNRQFTPSRFPSLMDAFDAAMTRDIKGESIEPVIDQASYEVGRFLIGSQAFDRNPGLKTAQLILIRKYCNLHPENIFLTLKDNPEVPFRDSLIRFAAYRYTSQLYDYASANNKLGYAIRNIKDDALISAVSKMATSGGQGQIYFPFLDNIVNGTQKFEDIDAVKDDNVKYYKLLVKTRMDYVNRMVQNRDTVRSLSILNKRLDAKAKESFINVINGLHESPDAVRFKVLQPLNAQELYYIVIAGETDLYTSSYVKGVYPLMMQRIGNRGDSLLYSVGFDRFKKFIRMAAGYNTLSNFLSTFPDSRQAQLLMTAFVNNLEKSEGLEDGVDVADSYASIAETIKPVAAEMLNNVKMNYDRNAETGNRRGMVIYNLLYKLFLSADSTNKIDLSKEFGIPPVYNVNYQSLVDDSSGKVVMQVFFYGDDDGRMNYSGFIPAFANGNWKKTEDNKNWIAFTSTKGKPMVVYANKWVDDEKNPGALEKTQQALDAYLEEKGIQPTVVVHRGHSYWVNSTIEQIKPSAKIVLLGSCGGYNVIHDVLRHSSDAHIIASKQTGKMFINQPFLNILNEKLRTGSNIDWIAFWNEFKSKAGKIEGFDDYIPPYKNLGAIFIKAYKSAMGVENDEE